METTILGRIQTVFSDVFDVDGTSISMETSARDVTGWDSVSHVMLIASVEKEFAIRFTSREITGFQCVGDIVNCIENKQKVNS